MTGMSVIGKLKYLLWAGSRIVGADTSCPACKETKTELVRRKYAVTALFRCPSCEVMFRVPKPSPEECHDFYQTDYTQGFTTDCPAPDELERLKASLFATTEKDYSTYIDVLRAVPVLKGSVILDYGCSWGYGSWQMAHAGYKVYSCEISGPRARYAAEKLDCNLCTPENLPEKVDCLFSSHVIEHLTNPRDMWEIAVKVVKPGGNVVLFLPNGNLDRVTVDKYFHRYWGLVHPLLLNPTALIRMGELYGFTTHCYTSPYDLDEIATKSPGIQTGFELLAIGSRQ